MLNKKYKILPDSIIRENSKIRSKSPGYVETALSEIGDCCGVSQCDGTIRHYDSVIGNNVSYSVRNGNFSADISLDTSGQRKKKFRVANGAIYTKDRDAKPLGQFPVVYIEDILDNQSSCCGVDCCGNNMIRLPNFSEGIVYEFGTRSGGVVAPTQVGTISTRNQVKREYRIVPDAIARKNSKHRTGGVPGYKSVKYFEEIQESMVNKQSYYGFNCCEGYIFLPDLNVPGDYYRVSIVAGAFVLTKADSCNNIINEASDSSETVSFPTIIITSPDCTEFAPATALLDGIFKQGMNIFISLTHSSGGIESFTYTVPTDQSAEITAQAIVNLGNTQIPTLTFSSNGEVIAILAGAGETLVLTNFSII